MSVLPAEGTDGVLDGLQTRADLAHFIEEIIRRPGAVGFPGIAGELPVSKVSGLASGTGAVTGNGSTSGYSTTITHGLGTTSFRLVAQSTTAAIAISFITTAKTTTQATIFVYEPNGTNWGITVNFDWIAVKT